MRQLCCTGLIVCCALWLLAGRLSLAQTPTEVQPSLTRFGSYANLRYAENTWGLIDVDVVNPDDQPVDLLTSVYFAGDSDREYARVVWVPARARRSSWFPALAPRSLPANSEQLDVNGLFFIRKGSTDELIKRPTGELFRPGTVQTTRSSAVTAVIPEQDMGERQEVESYEAIVALRLSASLPRNVYYLYADFLPPVEQGLQVIDQLVMMGDRLASDAAGMEAVRHWLFDGGRLWIMLDQVQPETVERLLGEAVAFQIVDRVAVTNIHMKYAEAAASHAQTVPHELDYPVDHVRVVPADVEVVHTLNGWPASFWMTYGKGRVLFTTVGARGWIRRRAENDPRPQSPELYSDFVATRSLEELSSDLLTMREPLPFQPEHFEPLVSEQIGYRTVSRTPVMLILGSFCGLLVVAGTWLARKNQLPRLILIGPAAAILASAILIGLGAANRGAVPATVAEAQLIEVEPGGENAQVSGVLAMYNPDTIAPPLGGRRGGIFMPNMEGMEGTTHRLVWTDIDRWHWQSFSLPAGVRTAPLTRAGKLSQPIEAHAQFGPDGLTGTLTAPAFQQIDDAIIATPLHGNVAVKIERTGSFTASSGNVLAANQFMAGTLLDDRQRSRQSIYRQLLSDGNSRSAISGPAFLFWADPLDLHFVFAEEVRRDGAALVLVPLDFDRTPPGTNVVIPSPFLPFRAVGEPGSNIPSSVYNNRTGQWQESKSTSQIWLRFQVPASVRPLNLKSAELTIRVEAPGRPMEIIALDGNRRETIARYQSPTDTFHITIDHAELLQLDPEGGLVLAIFIGEAASVDEFPSWQIRSLELEAAGMTVTP